MNDPRGRLATMLQEMTEKTGPLAVAVSGGVDSLTLASFAHRHLDAAQMLAVHAVSPAVPEEATARVSAQADAQGWKLLIIDAHEFADPRYRANPGNRCFFCKTNLYAAIGRMTQRQIVSGTNLDDLGDYRPGLDAARDHHVRHPFVEAEIDKAAVRALARGLGLGPVAELPAAPCLASRVETGIRIEAEMLRFVDEVERLVAASLAAPEPGRVVRCRLRADAIVIELDPASLDALGEAARVSLRSRILAVAPSTHATGPVLFAPYRRGSAFLTSASLTSPSGAARWTA